MLTPERSRRRLYSELDSSQGILGKTCWLDEKAAYWAAMQKEQHGTPLITKGFSSHISRGLYSVTSLVAALSSVVGPATRTRRSCVHRLPSPDCILLPESK